VSSLRPSEPLLGRIVRVEPFAAHHRDGLREAMEEAPEIFRYMRYPGFDRWFEYTLNVEDEIPFTVLADGRVVGSTRYLNCAPEHKRVEIGWTWVRRAYWGSGVNVETKLLLLEHAFERWGAMRVEFKTDARNLQTRGSLLALGARFEGVLRKHMLVGSGVRDSVCYAIVDDEWPAVKEKLQARLERRAGTRSATSGGSVSPRRGHS
jgi:RimJ/RimL family protein N-acetyltransferase